MSKIIKQLSKLHKKVDSINNEIEILENKLKNNIFNEILCGNICDGTKWFFDYAWQISLNNSDYSLFRKRIIERFSEEEFEFFKSHVLHCNNISIDITGSTYRITFYDVRDLINKIKKLNLTIDYTNLDKGIKYYCDQLKQFELMQSIIKNES